MNGSFVLMFESPWQWMVILAIILLLFGSSRLPQLAKSLAQSKKAFKEGLDEGEDDAHREKLRPAANESRASLSEVDDETLFEEARRRAAQRRAEESNQR